MQARHHGRHGRRHGHFAIALTLAAGLFLLHAILFLVLQQIWAHQG